MFRTISQLLLAVIIAIVLPLSFLIQSPIYLYRYIISKSVQRWNPSDYGKILTAISTSMAVDDITSKPMWSIVFQIYITGNSGFEIFKRQFEERVIFVKNENGELRKPELQQYVSKKFGFLFWKWDKDFRTENHITQKVDGFNYKILNKKVLDNVIKTLVYKPFKPKQSPWELIFLENYQDENFDADGVTRHVAILRIHHALADGFSIMKLLVVDFGDHKKLETPVSKHVKNAGYQTPQVKTIGQQMLQFFTPIYTLIRIPYDLAYIAIDIYQYNSNVWHLPEAQLRRSLNTGQAVISIETVKDLKNLHNCSFGTIVLAIYSAALRKFMSEAGHTKIPTNILCGMALPVPNHPDHKLRNHATAILARLPTGLSDPMERIREIENNQLKLKAGTLSISIFYMSIMTGALLARMVRAMTLNRNTTVVGSIFPGPNKPIPAGHFIMDNMKYAGGFTRGNVALAFSCLSVNSKLNILVGIDEGLVPESKLPATKMADYMIEELQILKEAVSSERQAHKPNFNGVEEVV